MVVGKGEIGRGVEGRKGGRGLGSPMCSGALVEAGE